MKTEKICSQKYFITKLPTFLADDYEKTQIWSYYSWVENQANLSRFKFIRSTLIMEIVISEHKSVGESANQ